MLSCGSDSTRELHQILPAPHTAQSKGRWQLPFPRLSMTYSGSEHARGGLPGCGALFLAKFCLQHPALAGKNQNPVHDGFSQKMVDHQEFALPP